jgi:hypothetical protein
MKLKQKSKFTTRSYELIEDGIKFEYKRFFQTNEEVIPFEEVPDNRVIFNEFPKKSFFAALILTIIALFIFVSYFFTAKKTDEIESTFFYLSIASVFWIYFWLNKNSYIVLAYNNIHLFFFQKTPSKESVESFINLVIEKRNEYIEGKYKDHVFNYDTNGSSVSTEIYKLYNLKEQEIISEEEYEQLKDELTGSKKNKVPVGFYIED